MKEFKGIQEIKGRKDDETRDKEAFRFKLLALSFLMLLAALFTSLLGLFLIGGVLGSTDPSGRRMGS